VKKRRSEEGCRAERMAPFTIGGKNERRLTIFKHHKEKKARADHQPIASPRFIVIKADFSKH